MTNETWTIIGSVAGIVGVIVAIFFGIKQTPEKKGSPTLRHSLPITSNIPKDTMSNNKVQRRGGGIIGNTTTGSISNNILTGSIINNNIDGDISNNNIDGNISNNKN